MDGPPPPGRRRRALRRVLPVLLDYAVPLAFGALLAAALWVVFINRCRGWSEWDPTQHLVFARHVFNLPGTDGIRGRSYGPLVYLWTNLFFGVFSPDRPTAELSIALFMIPLAFFSYHLGRVHGGRSAGLLCMILICLNLPVLEYGHEVLVDLPLLTAVTAMLVVFQRTDWFRRRRASLLLAVVLACGMLTKSNFFFFFWPPVLAWLVLLVRSARSPLLPVAVVLFGGGLVWALVVGALPMNEALFLRYWGLYLLLVALLGLGLHSGLGALERSRFGPRLFRPGEIFQQLRNGLVSLVLAGGWVLPWFIIHRSTHLAHLRINQGVVLGQGATAFRLLEFVSTGWLGAPLMLAAGVLLLVRARGRRRPLLVVAGLLVAAVFLALTCEPRARFLLPLLPFTAVLATWYLPLLGRFRVWALLLVLGLQVPFLFLPTKALHERPWLSSRITFPNPEWAAAESFDRREAERCAVAKRLVVLGEELRAQGPLPAIGVLVQDEAQLERMDHQDVIIGFTVEILESVLDLPIGHLSILNLSGMPDSAGVPTLLIHPARRWASLEPVMAALDRAGVRSLSTRFFSLRGALGLHLISVERR